MKGGEAARLPAFHLRFGDLLFNLATAQRERPSAEVKRLLSEAVAFYTDEGRRAAAAGFATEARDVAENLNRVVDVLAESDRAGIVTARGEHEEGARRGRIGTVTTVNGTSPVRRPVLGVPVSRSCGGHEDIMMKRATSIVVSVAAVFLWADAARAAII